MKMQQYLILSMAVVFFTACGSKKEAAQQTPAPQPTQTSAPGPMVIPADKSKIEAEKAPAKKKAKKIAQGKVSNKHTDKHIPHGKHSSYNKAPKKDATPTRPLSHSEDNTLSTQELQLTGGKSKSGMVYTGTNADFIITKLLAEENMKLATEQDRNAELAASVWDMAYLIDSAGQITVAIEFTKGNGLSKVEVKTDYQAGKTMQVLANSGTSSEIEISAECIDTVLYTNQCANLLVTFVKNGAVATAVLRQTLSNIWFEYEKVSQANEYADLVQFFKNARLDVETPNKIDKAFLHTFEVVKGKSGFRAVITGKHNQVLGFSADLLLKKDLSAPMTAVVKETKYSGIDMWMGRIAGKDLRFTQSISGAKLVKNNTKGEITIDMMVTSASTASKNSFTIKFSRVPVDAML